MERRPTFRVWQAAGVLVPALLSVPLLAQSPAATRTQPTFTRDIVPILQRSCQDCHRPGSLAPMSLLTYEDVRPWARSIKARVSAREMPPWFIDRNIGIRKFKNDISLSDAEIATVTSWVDAGSPRGNAADMPPARQFPELTAWQTGKPDLVVEMRGNRLVKAAAPDWWGNVESDVAVTEDRWIKSVEVKPISGYRMVHHAVASIVDPDLEEDEQNFNFSDRGALSEYSIGKNGDMYPDGTGVLLKAGSKIRFDFHYHAVGQEITDQSQLGIVFYPKGFVPKHVEYSKQLGQPTEPLDIPGGSAFVRSDGYTRFNKAGRITAFQPHMHTRGRRQCIELIYPDNKTEQISCANFSFNWHIVAVYADDAAPIYPAGTVLHVISWHDNSANKSNPDPRNWVGSGNRTIDEMGFAWISWYDLTDDEYKTELEARKGSKTTDADRSRN